jgi:serine/threonine-protein kinase RsbW
LGLGGERNSICSGIYDVLLTESGQAGINGGRELNGVPDWRGPEEPPSIDSVSIRVLPIMRPSSAQFGSQSIGCIVVTLETLVESVNLAEEMCLRVAESAGFGEDDCYRIGMSVREGVINAFHYGNQERPEKKIHLAVDLTADKMIIHVLDEGKGFDLSRVPDPLAQENLLSTSGRGIFLMRAFMDEFNVVPGANGGAEIIMSKKLPSAADSGSGSSGGQSAAPQQGA